MSENTIATRRRRTRELCRILAKHVCAFASPGLGLWDDAWKIVEKPSVDFLDAPNEFERTGNESTMDRAKRLSLKVRDAWRDADRQYRAGRRAEAVEQDGREEVPA